MTICTLSLLLAGISGCSREHLVSGGRTDNRSDGSTADPAAGTSETAPADGTTLDPPPPPEAFGDDGSGDGDGGTGSGTGDGSAGGSGSGGSDGSGSTDNPSATVVPGDPAALCAAMAATADFSGEIYKTRPAAATCAAGELSTAFEEFLLTRFNLLRAMHGLVPVSINPDGTPRAQAAALMMAANNNLNHHPPESWTCYSSAGAAGAGKSNLGLAYAGSFEFGKGAAHFVDDFIVDFGDANAADVGHRRIALCPMRRKVAYGVALTLESNALGYAEYWAGGSDYEAPVPPFVAFPGQGFYPSRFGYYQIADLRWSFAVPNATFDGASVTVTDAESGASLAVTDAAAGLPYYCLPALVYSVTGAQSGRTYRVEVRGVTVGGGLRDYSYETTLVTCTP